MPIQTSRRSFLTLAGASVGLVATGAREAKALARGGPGPAALEIATIAGLAGAELEVEVEKSGRKYTLEPRDFGEWEHQVGDRVVVVEDPSGHRSVKPYVTTVDAPLPRLTSRVEVGSVITVGERSARIGSASVKAELEAIRAKSPRAMVHWLLIENAKAGEFRVFGVIDGR